MAMTSTKVAEQKLLLSIIAQSDPSVKKEFTRLNEDLKTIGADQEQIFRAQKVRLALLPELYKKYSSALRETRKGTGELAKTTAALGAKFGLVVGGLTLLLVGLKGAKAVLQKMAQVAKAVAVRVGALASAFGKYALSLSSANELMEQTYEGMLRSADGAKVFIDVVRQVAVETGQSWSQLAKEGQKLLPYAFGDPQRWEELLRLATRLKAILPSGQEMMAPLVLAEAASGQYMSLVRRANVSLSMVQALKNEGYEGIELVNQALERMGVGADLVARQANTMKGILNTFRSVWSEIIVELGRSPFGLLVEDLRQVRDFLVSNRDQLVALASHLGSRLGELYERVRNALFGSQGALSDRSLVRAAEWAARFVETIGRAVLQVANLIANAIRSIMQALSGKKPVSYGPSGIGSRRGRRPYGPPEAAIPTVPTPGVSGADVAASQQEAATATQNYANALARVAQIQQAVAASAAALAAVQARLNNLQRDYARWTLLTQEIPERYKRGESTRRRLQILDAQEHLEIKQREHQLLIASLSKAKELLAEQKKIMESAIQAAESIQTAFEGIYKPGALPELEGVFLEIADIFDEMMDGVIADSVELASTLNKLFTEDLPPAIQWVTDQIEAWAKMFDPENWPYWMKLLIGRTPEQQAALHPAQTRAARLAELEAQRAAQWAGIPEERVLEHPRAMQREALAELAISEEEGLTTVSWLEKAWIWLHDRLTGKSIVPDIVTEIQDLWKALPSQLVPSLRRLQRTILDYMRQIQQGVRMYVSASIADLQRLAYMQQLAANRAIPQKISPPQGWGRKSGVGTSGGDTNFNVETLQIGEVVSPQEAHRIALKAVTGVQKGVNRKRRSRRG